MASPPLRSKNAELARTKKLLQSHYTFSFRLEGVVLGTRSIYSPLVDALKSDLNSQTQTVVLLGIGGGRKQAI